MYNPLFVGLYHNEPDACEPDGMEPDTTTVAVPPPTGEPFNNNEPDIDTQIQLNNLEKQQNDTLEEIIHFRDHYLEIDSQFNNEIETYIKKSKKRWNLFHWLKT